MDELKLMETAGHLAAVVAFLSVAVYVGFRRRALRRTVRRASLIYWLIVLGSLFFALVNAIYLTHLLRQDATGGSAPWLDVTSEYGSLAAQSAVIVALVSLKVATERTSRRRRVLAIGAHPDDIEIACGGTVAKMRDAGHQVCGLVLTQGELGGDAHIRRKEARRGAGFLDLDQTRVMDFADTRLQEQALDVLAAIEQMIQDFNPHIILTHSDHDQHQDHQAVHEATLRAARNQSTILCYESPSITQDFVPTFFVDIGDYLDIKMESMREHRNQRNKPYMQAERVRGIALFRGGEAKIRYAEGFEVVRALGTAIGDI